MAADATNSADATQIAADPAKSAANSTEPAIQTADSARCTWSTWSTWSANAGSARSS